MPLAPARLFASAVFFYVSQSPLRSDLMARSIWAAGGRPGDVVHVAYGYGLFTGGLGAHYGAERLGCTVVPMGGGQTEKQVQLITDFRPDIIMVTPSYMQVIIEEFRRQGLDPREMSVKVGIFGAEPWTEAMRRDIEAAAGIDAVDIYGLSEVMGPGVANECIETKDGPVIWEDHFYPEIVDPDTGAVVADGEEGELVFTTLTKEALPVVRYSTPDLTRLLPPTARSMRRMGKIVGRSNDMLIIRGVNVFPTQIEELILQHGQLSRQYQLVVTRSGALDEMQVLCEVQPQHAGAERDAIAQALQQRIKTLIGVSTTVSVGSPDSIERTLVGKARRVIDKRPYVGTKAVNIVSGTQYPINNSPVGTGQAGRPLLQRFGRSVATNILQPWCVSNYHSLQTSLDRRFSAGLMLKTVYTWSHSIDDNSTDYTLYFALPDILYRNRSSSGFDRRHNFRAAAVYELPWGPGRKWSNSGVGAAIFGGWQVNGVFSAVTGEPFTVTASGSSLNAPGSTQVADQVLGEVKKLGGIGLGNPFFDPNAFRPVTAVRFGNSGRNTLYGPGIVNVDLGIFRSFKITEGKELQFRAESFNFTNTPHFDNPSASASDMQLNPDGTIRSVGTLMSITSARADQRTFRFGLRFSF